MYLFNYGTLAKITPGASDSFLGEKQTYDKKGQVH